MAGAMRWVQTLTWPGLDHYNLADRLTLLNPDTQLTEAFVKAHDRLKFYWILGAGHSVRAWCVCAALGRLQEFGLGIWRLCPRRNQGQTPW